MPEFHLVASRSEPAMRADATKSADSPLPMFDEGFGFCLGGRKCYLNVRVGVELRSSDRLSQEGLGGVGREDRGIIAILDHGTILHGGQCVQRRGNRKTI